MATFGEAIIKFVGDMTGVQEAGTKEAEDAGEKSGGSWMKGFGGMLAGMAALEAVHGMVEFGKSSVEAAQDLQAAMSRSKAIFGTDAKDVQEWSDTTVRSMGLAGSESLKYANSIGNVLINSMGMAPPAAAKMSESVVKTSADLAAFAKVPIGTAMDDVTRAMEGQTRGMKSLGVSFSLQDVKQKAVQMGLAQTTSTVSQAAQAQAAYQLIVERSAAAHGYAAKSLQTYAGQQKLMRAEVQEAQEQIGTAMLPILTKLANVFNSVLGPAIVAVSKYFQQHQTLLVVVASAFAILVAAIGVFVAVMKVAEAVQAAFDIVMDANPIMLVVLAIIALIGLLVLLYFKWAPFRDLVNATGSAIAAFASGVMGFFQALIPAVGGFFSALGTFMAAAVAGVGGFFSAVGAWVSGAIAAIGAFFSSLGSAVSGVLAALGGLIAGLAGIAAGIAAWVMGVVLWFGNLELQAIAHVAAMVMSILLWLSSLYGQALSWIAGLVIGVVNWFNSAVAMVAGAMAALVASVVAWLASALGQAIGLATSIANAIGAAFSGAVGTVSAAMSGVVNAITSGLQSALGSAYSLGQQIIQGLVNGIESMASNVASTLSNIATSALNAAKAAVSGSPPMYGLGQEMMQGWAQGITENANLPIAASAAVAQAQLAGGSASVGAGAAGALTAGARGPALVINQATFNDEADLTSLSKKMEFAVQAGSF